MDEIVLQAMAKWPNVPAVYGWLALDRRGNWLIKRETIGNQALNAFISRNYTHDDAGRWYFQNGPQRVFVDLDYAPFVYRVTSVLNAPLALTTHTGAPVNSLLAHGSMNKARCWSIPTAASASCTIRISIRCCWER